MKGVFIMVLTCKQITVEDLLYHAVERAERKFAASALGYFDMFWVLDKNIVTNGDDRDVLAVITTPVINTEDINGIYADMRKYFRGKRVTRYAHASMAWGEPNIGAHMLFYATDGIERLLAWRNISPNLELSEVFGDPNPRLDAPFMHML
jgi:hypothetical protein